MSAKAALIDAFRDHLMGILADLERTQAGARDGMRVDGGANRVIESVPMSSWSKPAPHRWPECWASRSDRCSPTCIAGTACR